MGSAIISFASSRRQKRLEDIVTLKHAADYFTDTLLEKQTQQDLLEVRVKIVPTLSSEYNASWTLTGSAYDVAHPRKKDKRLHIVDLVDYVSFPEMLKTLAHELVHVVQFHTGRCKIIGDEWFWKGKSFGTDPYLGAAEDYKLPWEIEADKLDRTMARRFMNLYYKKW
jgi:hypothetical protein